MQSINDHTQGSVDFGDEGIQNTSRELSKEKFSLDVSAIESVSKM